MNLLGVTDARLHVTPALNRQRTDGPSDLPPPRPCPSAFAADLPPGARTILRTTGASGLASFGGFTHSHAERNAFQLTLAISRFDGFDVSQARHTAVVLPRRGDNFAHPHRAVRLVIMIEGEATLSAGGHTERLVPGGGAIVHGWDEWLYESRGDVNRVHVDIAADQAPFAAALSSVPALVWSADTPLLRAAAAALTEVVRRDDAIDAASRDALRRMAQSVILSVLAAPPGGGVPAPARQRQRTEVLAHIAANHASPDLNPAAIAAAFGVSMRSLQRLFEGEAMGVAEYIAAARLEHALAILREPLLREVSMEEVASRSGFGSVARMRRAVRQATGLSPTSVQAQAVGSELGPRTSAAPPEPALV